MDKDHKFKSGGPRQLGTRLLCCLHPQLFALRIQHRNPWSIPTPISKRQAGKGGCSGHAGWWHMRSVGDSQKQNLPAAVKRGFCARLDMAKLCRHNRASQDSSWGCRRSMICSCQLKHGLDVIFRVPCAPCCFLFPGKRGVCCPLSKG